MFKLYIYVYFWLVIFAVVLKLKENCKIDLVSKILVSYKLIYYIIEIKNNSYVYMDTFCFHPNEFILIVKSERSVYMNAK